ncbi:MAG: hypothetical protein HY820_37885 [Acidobacteria bacterium]|nr:hypothetical protein [Acidobacteriota bacterium]
MPNARQKSVWIGDIDGDGSTEVLFVYRPINVVEAGTPLYCFSADGSIKWQFMTSRLVRDDSQAFSGIYFSSIWALPARKQIIVSSNHSLWHPHQIALLDGHGQVIGEYWHPGHIRDLAVADLNKDGRQTLLLAGVNNNFKRATLVALPLDELPAQIPLTFNPFEIPAMGAGKEKIVILFPHSCITMKMFPSNRAFQVKVLPTGIDVNVIESYTEGGSPPFLIYTFNSKLELMRINSSSTCMAWHKKLEAEGKLDHPFSESEIDRLRTLVTVRRFR